MKLVVVFLFSLSVFCKMNGQLLTVDSIISQNSITDYRNQDLILIDFWATWCAPCIPATRQLEILQEVYSSEVFMISITDEPNSKIIKFLKEKPIRLMVVSDDEQTIFNKYQVKSRPYAVLLNRNGAKLWEGKPGDLNDNLLKKFLAEENKKKYGVKLISDIVGQSKVNKSQVSPNLIVIDTNFKADFMEVSSKTKTSFYGSLKSFFSEYKLIPKMLIDENELSKRFISVNFPPNYIQRYTKSELADSVLLKLKVDIDSSIINTNVYELKLKDVKMLWDTTQIVWEGETDAFLIGDVSLEANNISLKKLALQLSELKNTLYIYTGSDSNLYDFSFVYINDELMKNELESSFGIKIESKVRKVKGYKLRFYNK